MDKCIYCGSENLDKGLLIRGSKDIGHLHFECTEKTGGLAMFSQPEAVLADLCKDCGSISRFYVKNANHTFLKDKG
jgi:hypothetical protein